MNKNEYRLPILYNNLNSLCEKNSYLSRRYSEKRIKEAIEWTWKEIKQIEHELKVERSHGL